MPLAVIPGSQGYRNLKSKASWWPGRVDGEDNRVEPIAKPEYMPTFQLIPGEPVFTVGSCFARFIEVYLGRNGYQVPMASYKPKEEGDSLGLMNKFSPYSVLNEFQWALDPDFANFDQRRALCSEGGELWMDTQLVSKLALSEERAMARRFEVNGLFKLVKDCRIVILTLGLVEAWYDTKNRIYLNTSVSHYMQKYDPDRFELHVLSFKELYDCTRRTIELILKYGHPEARVLLTVSPVALTATFTGQDVMVANMYSKSALRTVAEHIWREFDEVDYLPSYESVMLSDRKRAFQKDLIHVQAELVSSNVNRMIERYTEAKTPDLSIDEAKKALAEMSDQAE